MRKSHGAVDSHVIARSGAPHGARKVAEPVGGEQERMLERRNEERARQMSLVVLNAVKLCA